MLDVELAVAPVEGAGVVPFDAGFDEPDDGAAGAAGAGAALLVPSCAGAGAWAWACVGEIPDMVRARLLAGLIRCCTLSEV